MNVPNLLRNSMHIQQDTCFLSNYICSGFCLLAQSLLMKTVETSFKSNPCCMDTKSE